MICDEAAAGSGGLCVELELLISDLLEAEMIPARAQQKGESSQTNL